MNTTYVPWQKREGAEAAAERGIVRTLIACLVDAGYEVSVDNGSDDYELVRSSSKAAIFDALAQTDEDFLHVYVKGHPARQGWVRLVWGNEPWEVICDYTIGLEAVIKPAEDKALRAEERLDN